MRPFPTPRVVVSKCLGFDRCRYNGAVIEDPFVARNCFAYTTPVSVPARTFLSQLL